MKQYKKYKKEILLVAAILVTIIFIISLIFLFKKDKTEEPKPINQNDSTLLETETETESEQEEKVVYKKKGAVASEVDNLNNLSYTEAFMKYNDGRLIQFAENCQSHPNRMVIANGSEIMLDNRSLNKEIISIGDEKYTLAPYGFKIIKLNLNQIPTTYLIDCTISQNVNTLIVE